MASGQSHPSSPAFTLLELLVVIAVLAALAAILLPSLGPAPQAARRTACASNLRQWATATRTYADLFDQYLPRRGQGKQPTTKIDRPEDWFNALPLVLGQPSCFQLAASSQIPRPPAKAIWLCPEAVDAPGTLYFSYGMNMWLSIWDERAAPDRITDAGPQFSMVLFADGPPDHCSVSPSAQPYSPVARHAGKVNIVFLDAHVEALAGTYVGCGIGHQEKPDLRWQVPGSTWDGPP